MKPRVSFTVDGEKSPDAISNHPSSSSPTVALRRTASPRSASVIISFSTQRAYRLPVTGSAARWTLSSQASPVGGGAPHGRTP